MGTLFSALDIGTSGFRAAQVQLDVAGHNIANVNKEGFSRQRAELATRYPNVLSFGQLGRGVDIKRVTRIRDQFLDVTFRQQVPGLGASSVQASYYALLEDSFLEPTENGFSTRLNQFFDSLNDLANNVEELPVREAFVAEAGALVTSFRELANRFNTLRTNANEEIRNMVPQLNSLAQGIAQLNERIRRSEFTGQPANDLRDDRDVLVDQLARLVNITWRETDTGEYTILVGADVLVDALGARRLEAVNNPALDPERPDLVELRFVDTGGVLQVSDGELQGAFAVRDRVIPAVDARMDDIARTIIEQINRIHSQTNGLVNLSGTISSSNDVSAPGDALTAAGLPFTVTPGTFDVVVYDGAGVATTTTITITAASTLNSLATDLNAIANFSASVVGNRIELGTAAPFTFAFANDTSGALTALGINALFHGTDARSIVVNPDIQAHPEWVSTAYDTDALATGDNSAALAMAAVRLAQVMSGGLSTVNDYYETTIANLGVDAQLNLDSREIQDRFVQDFDRRRQEVSGVSLDEEVTSLILYQRAFESSARVITVTDRMLDVLMAVGA